MAYVVTTASTVGCGHLPGAGNVRAAGSAKLRIGGHPVLRKTELVGSAVTVCGTTESSSPPFVKCLTVKSVTTGEALKLKAGGDPVLLDTLGGTTDGTVSGTTPQTALFAVAGQARLRAS
ncbi:hypothetical protein OG883_14165 [Streptomyces sp. NBC_01142]|uniref:hypothetical protein n=1 Tax=Streptomyces sp. NBC_01142 TaxID=2975865 RepID=UPI002252F42B|nr:hypothetical protein [Streptomyces sp. NBC_01142]MCX4821038.1 hypothetical protein [Streptomyces sp. NBC_01142]